MALAHVPSMPPLVVVVHHDPGTADSLRHAVESASGWQVLAADPSPAGIAAALAAGPSVALVGCDALAHLPADCRTPIVAIGDDDRPGDVRAALAVEPAACSPGPTGPPTCRASSPGSPPPASPAPPTASPVWSSPPAVSRAARAPPPSPSTWRRPGPAGDLLRSCSWTWPAASPSGSTWARPRPGQPSPRPPAPAAVDPSSRSFLVDAGGLDAGTLAEPVGRSVRAAAGRPGRRRPRPSTRARGRPGGAGGRQVHLPRDRRRPARHRRASRGRRPVPGRRPGRRGPLRDGRGPRAPGGPGRLGRDRPRPRRRRRRGHRRPAASPLAPREVRAALGDRLWGLVPDAAAELAAAAEDGVLLIDRHDLPPSRPW